MTTTVSGTFTAGPPGSSGACPGPYTGKVTFKDGTSTWFTPPTGSTNCTITDISGFALPYASKVEAVESGTLRQSCASNSVSFALTAGKKYSFTTYVVNAPPPPANGATVTLQIVWQ